MSCLNYGVFFVLIRFLFVYVATFLILERGKIIEVDFIVGEVCDDLCSQRSFIPCS